ncbi:MAG: DNA translocase FtsK 4TM domain-containing protein [Candidatus Magasanikbacteria bacterium]
MSRRRRQTGSSFNPTLSRGIIAVLLMVFSVIIMLSFFDKAGAIGIMLDEYLLSFLFGSIRYVVPAVILLLAGFLLRSGEYHYRPMHGMGAIFLFFALSGMMHMHFETGDMWQQALDGFGGGVFGMLAWPLKQYTGIIAGYVILVGLFIIALFLIFNASLSAFILFHQKILSGLGWFGHCIINITKKIYQPVAGTQKIKINGDYRETNDEDENENEVVENDEEIEEEEPKRKFINKQVGNESHEEDEESAEQEEPEHKPSDVWSKRVIIKNLPPLTLLSDKRGKPTSGDIVANAEIIQDTFSQFGIGVTMGEIRVGPTVTQYSLKPDKGVKLSRITGLSNDLALALAAHPIRIEAPIPGKPLVGIEVPNERAALVSVKELLESKEFKNRQHSMMIALGKDVAGKVWFGDLPRMPHLLIAGATGSGKTVCVNTIIMSLLFQNTAETLRIIMVDPKRVELTLYNGIPHLLTPVITNVQKTVNALKWTIGEMDRRFEVLASVGSRDIHSYNAKHPDNKMPHIVFVIDELADLMASAANEVEAGIIRLAQMARAVGIHIVVATQRPSVDVITGLMKANIPARIAFSVASQIDSRTILDSPGAEKLLGRGDMLFQTAELSKPIRIQGAFISEEELKDVVDYLKGDEEPEYDESITGQQKSGTLNLFGGASDDRDPLFDEARKALVQAGKASASFLQRRLKIGYARAARILDELEEEGIIGPGDGAKPREILVTETEVNDTMDAGAEFNAFDAPTKNEVAKDGITEEELGDQEDETIDEGIGDEIVEKETENEDNKY